MKLELTKFEKEVLLKLLNRSHPTLRRLFGQIGNCSVKSREYTGVGFFTVFQISDEEERVKGLDFKLGDVEAVIPGISDGIGLLLYVKDGLLEMLEAYTFDELWPANLENFTLVYSNGDAGDGCDWLLMVKQ